jgi:prophage antirepressor-like protein
MNNVVEFNNHNIDIITHNGQTWIAGSQIGKVLGYENAAKAIHNIYTNHKDEFDDNMSCTLKTRVQGQLHNARLFNREGAWLIGMFARTPKAAEFRKWVLKVLGTVADSTSKQVVVAEHTRALPTGKKEIVLSDKAKVEIGGIIKAVVHSELNNILIGSPKSESWEVSTNDLMQVLSGWYRTQRKADTMKFRALNTENEQLKQKLYKVCQVLK